MLEERPQDATARLHMQPKLCPLRMPRAWARLHVSAEI